MFPGYSTYVKVRDRLNIFNLLLYMPSNLYELIQIYPKQKLNKSNLLQFNNIDIFYTAFLIITNKWKKVGNQQKYKQIKSYNLWSRWPYCTIHCDFNATFLNIPTIVRLTSGSRESCCYGESDIRKACLCFKDCEDYKCSY